MSLIVRSRIPGGIKLRSLILCGLILCCFYIQNPGIINLFSKDVTGSFFFTYILRPLSWAGVAIIVWFFPRIRPYARQRLRPFINLLAFICAGLYIILMVMGGFADGFGRSPYSFTPMGITLNFFLVGSTLLGIELSRAFLINHLAGRRPLLVICMVSLLFALVSIPINKIIVFKTILEAVKNAGNIILPVLSENVFTSYLAYLGGPIPALIYQGILKGFRWFSPILPNLGWLFQTLLGTLVPFVSFYLVQHLYMKEAREKVKGPREKESALGWVVTSILSVMIIWFAAGLFPIYPTVIVTGSMEPMIKPGDVVLLKKIKANEVNKGDVIEFRHETINITHRVIDIIPGDKKSFRTKGDNNDSIDSQPVTSQQVRGRVLVVVPKIGWAALIIRSQGGGSTKNVKI